MTTEKAVALGKAWAVKNGIEKPRRPHKLDLWQGKVWLFEGLPDSVTSAMLESGSDVDVSFRSATCVDCATRDDAYLVLGNAILYLRKLVKV